MLGPSLKKPREDTSTNAGTSKANAGVNAAATSDSVPGKASSGPVENLEELIDDAEFVPEGETNCVTDSNDTWLPDDEVEEQLAVVDLHGLLDEKIIDDELKKGLVHIRNSKSEMSVVQIGGHIFSAKSVEADGTIMVFERDNEKRDAGQKFTGVTDVVLSAHKTFFHAEGDDSLSTTKYINIRTDLVANSEYK